MVGSASLRPETNQRIALPHSSTRNQRTYAHCRIVREIVGTPYQSCFVGPVKPPGAVLDISEFGQHPVVIECVGPVGDYKRGTKREVLWILWSWDWEFQKWKEIARSLAMNWEWSCDLRGPAMRCLYPKPGLIDVIKRGREVAVEIADIISQRLDREPADVKWNVLCSLHDQMAGKIANL